MQSNDEDIIKIVTTKNGDKGRTEDYDNCDLPKEGLKVAVVGEFDLLTSFLGVAKVSTAIWFDEIEVVQRRLQNINSLIMTDPKLALYSPGIEPTSESYQRLVQITSKDVALLEKWEVGILKRTGDPEPEFVLPGEGGSISAHFHVARAQCRRAERYIWKLINTEARSDLKVAAKYINRLSDFLFLAAKEGR